MKKKLIGITLIILSTLALAEGFGGEAGFGVGIFETDGKKDMVLKLNFNPEFKAGNLGLGFKLAGYFSKDGVYDYNKNGKADLGDVDLGFRYISWDSDEFKFRYGTFDSFVLGHGSLIYNYSNNEKTSLRVGLHMPKKAGVDVFFPLAKDIFGTYIEKENRPKASGGRVYVRPLSIANLNIPVISNIEVGSTYIADIRNKTDINTTIGGIGIAKDSDMKLNGYTVELALPIIEDVVTPYYDIAFVNGKLDNKSSKADGHFIGVMGKVAIVNYRLEYRNISKNMTPGFFGSFYEVNSLEQIYKVANENNDKRFDGYFGDLGFNFMELIKLNVAYEDYFSDDINPHLYGKLDILPENKKLNSVIYYDQQNMWSSKHKDNFLNEDTIIRAKIKAPAAFVGIPGPFALNVNIDQTYYYDKEKEKYQPKRVYTAGLSFDW